MCTNRSHWPFGAIADRHEGLTGHFIESAAGHFQREEAAPPSRAGDTLVIQRLTSPALMSVAVDCGHTDVGPGQEHQPLQALPEGSRCLRAIRLLTDDFRLGTSAA